MPATILPRSFTRFVYPFEFDPSDFEQRIDAVNSKGWNTIEKIWTREKFATADFLHNVGKYLNPEDETHSTAQMWRLSGDALQSPRVLGGGVKNAPVKWTLIGRNLDLEFRIESVNLSLYSVGIGFLAITVIPESNSHDDWLDFVHHFRFMDKRRGTKIKCIYQNVNQQTNAPATEEPYFPEIGGGLIANASGTGNLDAIVEGLLKTASLDSRQPVWWGDIYATSQLLPFVGMFLEESLPQEEAAKILYRMRYMFNSTQPIFPNAEDMDITHPGIMSYVKNQWMTFSLEGAGFLAVAPPDSEFFRVTLPDHLQKQYYLLYMFVLHQRFALISLSEKVVQRFIPGENAQGNGNSGFSDVHDRLLVFMARGMLSQVAQRENHHRYYKKWRETFDIENLYEEVSQEIRDIHEHILVKQAKRLETRIDLLAALIGIPSILLAFLGVNLRGFTASEGINLEYGLAFVLGGFVMGALLLWMLRR